MDKLDCTVSGSWHVAAERVSGHGRKKVFLWQVSIGKVWHAAGWPALGVTEALTVKCATTQWKYRLCSFLNSHIWKQFRTATSVHVINTLSCGFRRTKVSEVCFLIHFSVRWVKLLFLPHMKLHEEDIPNHLTAHLVLSAYNLRKYTWTWILTNICC